MIDGILSGLSTVMMPLNLLLVFVGCFAGTFIGMLPGLGPISAIALMIPITYGFDPLMGEISIYQGRPYVSIDGRYRKAQETGNLDGVSTRPANKQEREDWQIPVGDFFFDGCRPKSCGQSGCTQPS